MKTGDGNRGGWIEEGGEGEKGGRSHPLLGPWVAN